MTAPRDAIGLSERLRDVEAAERRVAGDCDCRPEDTANWKYADTCREAATAIDALQARVKEADEACQRLCRDHGFATGHGDSVADMIDEISAQVKKVKELEGELTDTQAALTGVNSDWAKAESRATRAEQERDEALERLKPFAKAGELFQTREPEDYDQCVYAPAAGSEYNLTASHLRAARDLVRRLAAGTEKEGK